MCHILKPRLVLIGVVLIALLPFPVACTRFYRSEAEIPGTGIPGIELSASRVALKPGETVIITAKSYGNFHAANYVFYLGDGNTPRFEKLVSTANPSTVSNVSHVFEFVSADPGERGAETVTLRAIGPGTAKVYVGSSGTFIDPCFPKDCGERQGGLESPPIQLTVTAP